MKKKILIAILLSSTVILGWCFQKKQAISTTTNIQEAITETTGTVAQETSSTEPVATSYEYTNKEAWFTLQVPAKRTFQENIFNSLVMLYAPQEAGDTIKENLGIISEKIEGDVNLNSYYELTKGNLETIISDFTIESKEDIKIDGIDAIKLIYKGTQQDKKLQREQILLIKNNTAYISTYTATQDTFSDFVQEAEAIMMSCTLQ